MPGMQRFISYLYLYENEEKAGNVGFAKIELRGEDCRIEVHMRGTFTNNLSCKIYLFTNQQNFIHGICIGNMKILNGVGNFGKIMPAGKIGTAEKKFADMDGLLVLCEDERIFATRWKEGTEVPIGIRTFREELEQPVQPVRQKTEPQQFVRAKEEIQQPVQPAQPQYQESEASVSEKDNQKQESEVPASEKDNQKQESEVPASKKDNQKQETEKNVVAESEEEKVVVENAEENGSIHVAEVPMRNIFPELEWKEQWKNMLQEYQVMHPFQSEEITCIRIELKDLRELPKRYWYLGNNSFLLHGFFNYHHLVVGNKNEDGVEKWFLGVPGVYQHQERVMAAIFGFQEFLPEAGHHEKSGEPLNQFGYWCRQMDE